MILLRPVRIWRTFLLCTALSSAEPGWITAAGTYEASTGTFTPNEGITVDENYVKTVSQLVQAKYTYAKQIIQQDYYRILYDSGVTALSETVG